MSTLYVDSIQPKTTNGIINAKGMIIQVLQATDTTQRTVASATFGAQSNTLAVSITPQSTSSKILISFSTSGYNPLNGSDLHLTIFRDLTNIGHSSYGLSRLYSNSSDIAVSMTGTKLDEPNTTSEITYQVYARTDGGGTAYYGGNTMGTITLMEIGG